MCYKGFFLCYQWDLQVTGRDAVSSFRLKIAFKHCDPGNSKLWTDFPSIPVPEWVNS